MKYIHHDTAALDDEKLAELIMEFGYEGYGLFWAILEKIGKQEKPIKTVVLKKQLHVGKRLDKCWQFMESIGLICSNNGETFNKQLANYAGKYQLNRENTAKRVAQHRSNQEDTENVTRYDDNGNAPVTLPSIIEEKRIEEKKDDDDAGASTTPPINPFYSHEKNKELAEADVGFTSVYYQWGLKGDKLPRWLEAFNRMLNHDGKTLKTKDDYRKHFGNWLKFQKYSTTEPEDYSPGGPPKKDEPKNDKPSPIKVADAKAIANKYG